MATLSRAYRREVISILGAAVAGRVVTDAVVKSETMETEKEQNEPIDDEVK